MMAVGRRARPTLKREQHTAALRADIPLIQVRLLLVFSQSSPARAITYDSIRYTSHAADALTVPDTQRFAYMTAFEVW